MKEPQQVCFWQKADIKARNYFLQKFEKMTLDNSLNNSEETDKIESRNIALDAFMQLYSKGNMSFYEANNIVEEEKKQK